jgi:hypothetical protein
MADRDARTRSVACTTSTTKSPSQRTIVMFSMTLEDSRQGVEGSWRLCKILSVVGHRRGNWREDCTQYGLFVSVPVVATLQGSLLRYCIPMDNARPSLDLANFDKVLPDKNIKGTSKSNF